MTWLVKHLMLVYNIIQQCNLHLVACVNQFHHSVLDIDSRKSLFAMLALCGHSF